MSKSTIFFYKLLITWYLSNKRDLPWRKTKDPYRIWLSEIILQQTRVLQGLPYYNAFIERFPTVFELADAHQQDVLKLWQGLGYYSRARNLHETAQYIAGECQGKFPANYEGLLKLKGVGDYTASAVASICFGENTAVVDGNVYRVLSRVFGIKEPINTAKGVKLFKSLAQELLDGEQPGTYNQAVMEFGARYCVPSNPDCTSCIFKEKCEAFRTQTVSELPVKLKKTRVKKHYFNFLVCLSETGETLLEQRTEKGIWQQLYQFPLIDSVHLLSKEQLEATSSFKKITEKFDIHSIVKFNETPILHKLSHKDLHTTFWILETGSLPSSRIPVEEIHLYPVPVLLENFISTFPSFKE